MKQYLSSYSAIPALIIFGLVAVAVVGITVAQHQSDFNKGRNETAQSSLTGTLPTNLLPMEEVERIAAADQAENKVTGVQLEQVEGMYVYKVATSDGTTLHMNAKTGEIIKKDSIKVEGNPNNQAVGGPAIGFYKAREIALAHKRGGIIATIKLEQIANKLVYAVQFTDESRIELSAQDGTILKVQPAEKNRNKKDSEKSVDPTTKLEGAPSKPIENAPKEVVKPGASNANNPTL